MAHDRQYQAVYGARMRKTRGPVAIWSRPNDLDFHRLGLAIGRKAGMAHDRVRIKRLIRESFRLLQHSLPRLDSSGYDLIVSVGGQTDLTLTQWKSTVAELVALGHKDWQRRRGT